MLKIQWWHHTARQQPRIVVIGTRLGARLPWFKSKCFCSLGLWPLSSYRSPVKLWLHLLYRVAMGLNAFTSVNILEQYLGYNKRSVFVKYKENWQNVEPQRQSFYTHGVHNLANNSSLVNIASQVQYKQQIKYVPKALFDGISKRGTREKLNKRERIHQRWDAPLQLNAHTIYPSIYPIATL